MVRTQIQLTEEQMERLRTAAERERVSIAELIRRSIDRTIGCNHGISLAAQKRRAIELAGRFASGRENISAEHDKHLEEAFRA
jgi:hypothetical protein